jgi:hypothetical protein
MKQKLIIFFLVFFTNTIAFAETAINVMSSTYESSPFGFHYCRGLDENLSDLGVNWVRVNAIWKTVQETEDDVKRGIFKWDALENNWKYNRYQGKDVNLLATISLLGGVVKDSYIPNIGEYNRDNYIKFVKKLVERYDGDGFNDAPYLISPIKYWQVENEPPKWLSDYAELQKTTYQTIKEVCGYCQVVIGGIGHASPSEPELLETRMFPIFEELNGNYVDIIDFHWFGLAGDYNPKKSLDRLKQKLKETNFDVDHMPFWITETGTYSGKPKANPDIRGPSYQRRVTRHKVYLNGMCSADGITSFLGMGSN